MRRVLAGYPARVPTDARPPRGEAAVLPTAPEDVDIRRVRLARTLRRLFVGALTAFLLLGLLGVWGVRTTTVSATGGGYALSVTYATVSRPGLATPWSVTVHRPGGFDGPVTLATTNRYFDLFDENGLDPEPSRSTTAGDLLVWEFEPPEGDTLTVSFDARLEPAVHRGRAAETAVLEDGRRIVAVRYRTRVMP